MVGEEADGVKEAELSAVVTLNTFAAARAMMAALRNLNLRRSCANAILLRLSLSNACNLGNLIFLPSSPSETNVKNAPHNVL